MAKEPIAGRVKTRLARDIGVVAATRFFRTNVAVTLGRLAQDPRWQMILAMAPRSALSTRMFPAQIARMSQGRGDLGVRMAHVAKAAPAGPLVIIGADIPAIRPGDIAAAFAALKRADVVFGPSGDGGYWLVGFAPRVRQRVRFDNVRWSSVFALADSRAALAPFTIKEIAPKDDVDDGDDLARLTKWIGRWVV